MVQVKIIIDTEKLRQPKKTIRIIRDLLLPILGEVFIDAPEGYLTKKDLMMGVDDSGIEDLKDVRDVCLICGAGMCEHRNF